MRGNLFKRPFFDCIERIESKKQLKISLNFHGLRRFLLFFSAAKKGKRL